MGKEIKVSSIEEMCALMRDNRLPADKPRKRKPRKDQGFKKLLDDKMKKL